MLPVLLLFDHVWRCLFLRIDDLIHFQFGSYGPITVTYCLKQGSSTFSVVKYGERPHRCALQAAVACRLRVGDLRSQTRKLCFFWGPHVAIRNEILQKWSRNGQDSPVCSNSILIVTATDHNTICLFFLLFFFVANMGLRLCMTDLYMQLINVFGNINNILENMYSICRRHLSDQRSTFKI